MEYILNIGIFICFYTLLSQSLSLIAGKAGLISLSQAGFSGIGAYTTALLSSHYGMPFWVNLPIALIINGIIAIAISQVALRTIEDYFIVCTLGIQIIIFSAMNNWLNLTNGPLGIPSISHIQLMGIDFNNKLNFLLLSIFFTIVVWWILRKISASGFGKTLIALSEDEVYTQSIGKNVYLSKVLAFTISAMLAAIPGTLYAHYISYIDPTSFTLNESIFILSIVIIGGTNRLSGIFFASAFMVLLPELLRYLGIPGNEAANIRQIIYGFILVFLMMNGKNGFFDIVSKKNEKRIIEKKT